jgi:hypothetical protein
MGPAGAALGKMKMVPSFLVLDSHRTEKAKVGNKITK